jgi:hypothetical protein
LTLFGSIFLHTSLPYKLSCLKDLNSWPINCHFLFLFFCFRILTKWELIKRVLEEAAAEKETLTGPVKENEIEIVVETGNGIVETGKEREEDQEVDQKRGGKMIGGGEMMMMIGGEGMMTISKGKNQGLEVAVEKDIEQKIVENHLCKWMKGY